MPSVEWNRLDHITNLILNNLLIRYACQVNLINKAYRIDDFYEPYDINIEWNWTKQKSLEWLKEAWLVLSRSGLTTYLDELGRHRVYISYLALIDFYLEEVNYWRSYFGNNYFIFFDLLKLEDRYILQIDTPEVEYSIYETITFEKLLAITTEAQAEVINSLKQYPDIWNKLVNSINQSLQPELDEDTIYYSLEEFYQDEYYLNHKETEAIIEIQTYKKFDLDRYCQNYEKKENIVEPETNFKNYYYPENNRLQCSVKEIAKLFNGTIFIWEKSVKRGKLNLQMQEFEIQHDYHDIETDSECLFSLKTFGILEALAKYLDKTWLNI